MPYNMQAFHKLSVTMHFFPFNGNTQESLKIVSAYEYLFS